MTNPCPSCGYVRAEANTGPFCTQCGGRLIESPAGSTGAWTPGAGVGFAATGSGDAPGSGVTITIDRDLVRTIRPLLVGLSTILAPWVILIVLASILKSSIGILSTLSAPIVSLVSLYFIAALGGGIDAAGYGASVAGAGSVHFFFIAFGIGLFYLMRFAFRRFSLAGEVTLQRGTAAAVGAALGIILISLWAHLNNFATSTVSSLAVSTNPFLPIVVVGLLSYLASGGPLPQAQVRAVTPVLRAVRSVIGVFVKVLALVVAVIATLWLLETLFKAGSGAPLPLGVGRNTFGVAEIVLATVLSLVIGAIALPNIGLLAMAELSGAPIAIGGTGSISGLPSLFLPATSVSQYHSSSLVSQRFGIVIVIVFWVVMLAVMAYSLRDESSKDLWWIAALTGPVLGGLAALLSSVAMGGSVGAGLFGGGSLMTSFGAPIPSAAAVFGVLGALAGATCHPSLERRRRDTLARGSGFYSAMADGLHRVGTRWLPRPSALGIREVTLFGFRDAPSRRAGRTKAAVLGVALLTAVSGDAVMSGWILARVPPFSQNAAAASTAIAQAIASGQPTRQFDRLMQFSSGEVIASQGMSGVHVVQGQSSDGEKEYRVEWPRSAGSIDVWMTESSKWHGLFPSWQVSYVDGSNAMPWMSLNQSGASSFIKINGQVIKGAPQAVMPGNVTLSASSINPSVLKSVATFASGNRTQEQVARSQQITYSNTVTTSGWRDVLRPEYLRELKAMRQNNSMCTFSIGAPSVAPQNDGQTVQVTSPASSNCYDQSTGGAIGGVVVTLNVGSQGLANESYSFLG